MNYLGHLHVARAAGHDDPALLLGSVLPDLASMSGVRVDRQRLAGPLADGVRCHLAADEVFHAHPEFRRGAAAVRTHLAAVGLPSGPARALGHVGWELVLDGTLVGSATEESYWSALEGAEAVLDVLDGGDRTRWQRFLRHRDARPRLRYDDPSWVAERLHAMLAHRPRLRFGPEHLATVTRALEDLAPAISAAAPTVLDDVTAALAS